MSEQLRRSNPDDVKLSRRLLITGSTAAASAVVLGGGLATGTAQAATPRAYTRPRVPGAAFLPEPGISHISPKAASRGVASVMHRDTVTISINGTRALSGPSGFGTKLTATPIVWDDASGPANVLDKWTTAWPDLSSPQYNTQRRNAFRSVAPPHNLVGRYITGCHFLEGTTYNARKGPNVYVGKIWQASGAPVDVYASCWMRFDPDYAMGPDNNYKSFKWRRDATNPDYMPIGGNGHSWHASTANEMLSPSDTQFRAGVYTVAGKHIFGSVTTGRANPMAGWVKYEIEQRLHPTDPDVGFLRLYENGRLIVNYQGITDPVPGPYVGFTFGHFGRPYGNANNWRYLTDCYLDNSLARIVIADGQTWESSTLREVQVPSAWSDRAVTFKAWQGAHKALAGTSLFVVTPDNKAVKVGTFA